MTILSCASLKQLWKMCGWRIWDTPATIAKSERQKCDQQCSGEISVLGSGYIIISFHEMGFSLAGIWSHRASPCQTVVLLLGKQSGGQCDPSHSSRGVEWVYTAMQSANFTTANRGVEASSGYMTAFSKSFQLRSVREAVLAGRERWSHAETYSHASTALPTITVSLWKLASQSKLISYSGN